MKTYKLTVSLTAEEVHGLWGIVDGAADAGSCPDGLTQVEHDACDKVTDKLHKLMAKIKAEKQSS